MIKVNLSVSKSAVDLENVGGFDFSKINVKMVIIAIIFSYIPEWFLYEEFEQGLKTKEQQISKLSIEQKKLAKKKRDFSKYEDRYKNLSDKKSRLEEKLKIVKEIITTKKNPMPLLYYMAKNIPESAWIHQLTIIQNSFDLKGKSKDYKSIGDFIETLKQSIFFGKTLKLDSSKTVEDKQGSRIEEFNLKGNIIRFN